MDTTPLIAGSRPSRGVVVLRPAVLACCTLAAVACVVWTAARNTTSIFASPRETTRASPNVEPTESLGQEVAYEPHCPSVPPRTWTEIPEEGSAHLLLLGDSSDKLWHSTICSNMLPDAQRCEYTGTIPPSWGLPNNIQPFACVNGDSRCRDTTCYPGDGDYCWIGEEYRADAACKPVHPGASTVGFTHIPETDIEFDLTDDMSYGVHYLSPALSSKVGERLAQAVEHFADFTTTRPIVVSLDVMFWWVAMRYNGFGGDKIRDPAAVAANLDSIKASYREGILGLVNIIQDALELKNRVGVVVAKVNHNPSYEDGSLELQLHLTLREALLDIFERDPSHEEKGLYLFDWYAVSEGLKNEGKWDMLDWMHQGPEASQLETEAYMHWTKVGLPPGFEVRLQ